MKAHQTRYRVIYGDTDNMGIVYYANYLRMFEIGRTEMLRGWGMSYREVESRDILLPVSEVQCKYMTPAKYDELLIIHSSLDTEMKAGLKIDYRITSEDEAIVHVTGFTRHAFLNREGRVIRPPGFFRQLIRNRKEASDD